MRQRLPTATTLEGKSRVTTLPAPTAVLAPIVTPRQTMARPPSRTLSNRWSEQSGAVEAESEGAGGSKISTTDIIAALDAGWERVKAISGRYWH